MILNVAPMFDIPTEYSAKWNKQLMKKLDEKHISLLAEDAVRWNFEEHVKEINPELVVFYDHGDRQGLLQQGGDEYLIDKKNDKLLMGRDIYTMACLWGSDGGADAYRKGATAVWAYTKEFSFVTTDEETFSHLGNLGLILRRKQHLSWEDCVVRVKDAYNEKIDELRDSGNPWIIISLVGNRDALICWTDTNQPPSDCAFRNMATNLFGTAGQKLSKSFVVTTIAYYASWGYGVYSIYQLKGSNIVLEGIYTTLAIMFILPLALLREHIRWLKR